MLTVGDLLQVQVVGGVSSVERGERGEFSMVFVTGGLEGCCGSCDVHWK